MKHSDTLLGEHWAFDVLFIVIVIPAFSVFFGFIACAIRTTCH